MLRSVREILRAPRLGDRFIYDRDDLGLPPEEIEVISVSGKVVVRVTSEGSVPVIRYFLNAHAFNVAYGFLSLG